MKLFKLAVLVPLALVAVLVMVGFMAWVVSVAPGWLSAAAFVVLGVFALWFVLGRRNAASAGSEYSFLGRSGSKEGLL